MALLAQLASVGPACPAGFQLALLVQLTFSWPISYSQAGLQLVLLAPLAYVWATADQGGLQLVLLALLRLQLGKAALQLAL